jgi:hypothetical protein
MSRPASAGNLTQAVEALAAAVLREAPNNEFGPLLQNIQAVVQGAAQAELDAGVVRLAEEARGKVNAFAATAAIFGCGLLIEDGADAAPVAPLVVEFARQAVAPAARFQRALTAAWAKAEAEGTELTQQSRQEIANQVGATFAPEEAALGNLFRFLSPPLLAVLLRGKAARKAARDLPGFVEDVREFRDFGKEPEALLTRVLEVLDDEELLVLHPCTRQGFRVAIAGITHNFQLHTLLADALVGDPGRGLLPGQRPDPRVVSASRDQPWTDQTPIARACFHMQDWTSIQADGTVDASPFAHLVWHEGKPADIPLFEGRRVVVLSPPTLNRTWKAPRDFVEMAGEVRLLETLPGEVVDDWVCRIAAAPRPEAEGEDDSDGE